MIKTVSASNQQCFESAVNELLEEGYKILSCNCGFIDNAQYDYCDQWQAILLSENKKV